MGVLAVWGLVALMWQTAHLCRRHCRRPSPLPASLLLLVRNREHEIEGVLRGLTSMLRAHRRAAPWDLVVVDLRSTDETPRIIERLARQWNGFAAIQMTDRTLSQHAACEIGLMACQSRVVLVVDLTVPGEVRPVLATVENLLGTHWP